MLRIFENARELYETLACGLYFLYLLYVLKLNKKHEAGLIAKRSRIRKKKDVDNNLQTAQSTI